MEVGTRSKIASPQETISFFLAQLKVALLRKKGKPGVPLSEALTITSKISNFNHFEISNLKNINYLENFKNFIINRVKNYDPNISEDKFDILISSIWYQYIFQN